VGGQDTRALFSRLREIVQADGRVALATVISNLSDLNVRPAAKMLIFPDGQVEGTLGHADLDARVLADAQKLLAAGKSRTQTYAFASGEVEVYVESVLPPTPLVVIGGDPDAVPIVNLGKQLGFKVILVDHRPNFANRERYPAADETVVATPEELAEKVRFDAETFVLVKTHNYLKDKEILKTVLKSPARYVGQLGPRARMNDLLADLRKEGFEFSEAELSRLYAPVGLDLAAESPEQIAVSILGEMLAVKSGRAGGFLREQSGAIHPRE